MYKRILFCMLLLSVSQNVFSGKINVGKLHKADWIEVSSGNFQIVTDADKGQAQAMGRELEQFRYFLALLLGFKQRELPEKIPVVLTKNKGTFTAMGLPAEYAGFVARKHGQYTIFANSKGFSSSSDGRSSLGRQTVLHEITHLLMNNASLELANPPWYSEGVAEYFGTYLEKKGQIILGDMSLLQDRFYALKRPGMGGYDSVDTESLFKLAEIGIPIDANMMERRETERFYARSFAVVHYMNADPQRRKKMYQYLYLINKDHSVDDAFRNVFQMPFAELDKQVDQYINSNFVFARVFKVGKGGVEYPEFSFTTKKLEQREAIASLVPRIAMVGGSQLLEQESVDAMYRDIENLYPDFFADKESGLAP